MNDNEATIPGHRGPVPIQRTIEPGQVIESSRHIKVNGTPSTLDTAHHGVSRLHNATISTRKAVGLGGRNVLQAASQVLTDRGESIVSIGCPIDDQVAVRHDNEWHLWRSDEPDVLVNALGPKVGLVDPDVAWVQTVTALNADCTKLVVLVPDLEGRSLHSWPSTVDVISVAVAGEILGFDIDHPAGHRQWVRLHNFLTVQLAHAVERGESLAVGPIQYDRGGHGHPVVMSFAEPGDNIEWGEGFYVEVFPEPDDDGPYDGIPIAPYRRSSLTHVFDTMCDVIKSWGVSPLNLTTSASPYLRGLFTIPERPTPAPSSISRSQSCRTPPPGHQRAEVASRASASRRNDMKSEFEDHVAIASPAPCVAPRSNP